MPTVQEVKFKRKTTTEIDDLEIEDGALIYNVDNGKTYMDYGNERIQTGGNADTMIYVGDEEPTDEDIKLWIDTPISETKASEIVNEYTESDKVGYSTEYANNNFQTKGFILYDNESGNTGDISLSDDVSNYDYLEVFGFESTNQSQLYAKYDVSLNKNFTISSVIGQQNGNFMRIEAKTYAISGSSMTVNNSSHINVFTKVVNEQNSTTSISITKVIGYKTGLFE